LVFIPIQKNNLTSLSRLAESIAYFFELVSDDLIEKEHNVELFWPYLALAASAFTSATILPGTSEAAFAVFVQQYPHAWAGAWLLAGVCNGLGSMVSYGMGRLIPPKKQPSEKVLRWLRRWGVWSLLLAWLPLVGDGLPIAAGWLRLNAWASCLMLLAGKFLRYGRAVGRFESLAVKGTNHFQTAFYHAV
jgi:membrane protein YqaA with SNARE-associated domain